MAHIAGHFYHVYNRGCNREIVFANDDNYRYLLRQAKRLLPASMIGVIAYCLMPNHYHFLLRSDSNSAVGGFIQRLFSGYTQAINRQHGRKGTLFEGRAKSIEVDDERYAVHLCRYIHLNPVAAGLAARPDDWPWSNYLEWVGKRAGTLIDRDLVKLYYPRASEYESFICSSLDQAVAEKIHKYCLD